MALTKCRECGREISSSAKKCPHCGVARPAGGLGIGGMLGVGCLSIIAIGIIAGIAGTGAGTGGSGSSSSASRAPPQQIYHATTTVNLRKAPGTSSDVVGQLHPGSEAYVGRSDADGWAPVYRQRTGDTPHAYVKLDLLSHGHAPTSFL